MGFADITGHPRAKSILRSALKRKRPSHSYLFSGPEGVGKWLTAVRFAQALACAEGEEGCGACTSCRQVQAGSHPDVHFLASEGESIKIDRVRHLQEFSCLQPIVAPWVVNLIDDADRLTPEAGSSLLKILEEPPSYVVNILVSSRPHLLQPTILSRCQEIVFQYLSSDEMERTLKQRGTEHAELLCRLAGGRIGEALRWGEKENWKRRQRFLELGLQLVSGNGSPLLISESILKERRGVLDFLRVLLSLWRDFVVLSALRTAIAGEDCRLINLDQEECIRKIAHQRSPLSWGEGARAIEEATELSFTSVNMSMVLPVLLLKLEGRVSH